MTLLGSKPHHERVLAVVLVVTERPSGPVVEKWSGEPNSARTEAFWQDVGRAQPGPERTPEAPETAERVQPACPTGDNRAPDNVCARPGCGCRRSAHDIRGGHCPWFLGTYVAPRAELQAIADRCNGKTEIVDPFGALKYDGCSRLKADGTPRETHLNDPPKRQNHGTYPTLPQSRRLGCTCEWHGHGFVAAFDRECPVLDLHKDVHFRNDAVMTQIKRLRARAARTDLIERLSPLDEHIPEEGLL